MNIFETIKALLNIEDVYEVYTGYTVKDHKATCFFHNDRHPSMSFKDKVIFNCFTCGTKGDVFTLVKLLFGLTGLDAAEKLNNDFRLNIEIYRGKSGHKTVVKTDKVPQKTRERIDQINTQKREQQALERHLTALRQEYEEAWKIKTIYKPLEENYNIDTDPYLVDVWWSKIDKRYFNAVNKIREIEGTNEISDYDRIDDELAKIMFIK